MASELKVDKLTGVTTAGSIDVTGEGNSTTTNLQQGLAKAWINFAGAGTSINDSLGMSSLGDDATGKYTITMSSAMGNTNYSVSFGIQELGTQNNHATVLRSDVTITTTVFGVATYSSGTYQDVTLVYEKIHGDLA
jgi:hypothetical protein